MEVDVTEIDTPEGKKVARLLLRDECLHSLICNLFALPIGRDKLISNESKEGQSSHTTFVEHVLCTCRG